MSTVTDPAHGATAVLPASSLSLAAILRRPLTAVCVAGTGLLLAVGLLAPLLAPYDPNDTDVLNRLQGPSALHWLGTDELGRDTLSRLLYGTTTAVETSLEAVALAILLGVPIGLVIGYFGGWWDRIVMRLTDIAQSIPSLIFAFAVIAILGRGTLQTAIAVAIVFGIILLRIARGLVLRERELLYVDAARVGGLSTLRILFREILPNVAGPLIVESALMLGSAIMLVTMLSFLGLGLDAETPDWGSMLDAARKYQMVNPFMTLPPGLAIMFAVLLFNFSGDTLRDALMGRRRSVHRRPREAGRRRAAAAAKPAVDDATVLAATGLSVGYATDSGLLFDVLSDVAIGLRHGETVGLVGESGSGKSTTGMAMIGLLPAIARRNGQVWLGNRDLMAISPREAARLRGSEIAMVFQDPVGAFSPVHTVGQQIIEPLQTHRGLGREEATRRAVELLDLVGIPDAAKRINDYPHQFSGGMAQRAMIAMALSCEPKVLIADEPTSALDVTVQAQVLKLLGRLSSEYDTAVLLITHDLGVVAETCDRVVVMYAGEIVEEGPVASVLRRPRHPYTHALLKATPRNEAPAGRLPTIPGAVPPPWEWPAGCRFAPRCGFAIERCAAGKVHLADGVRCIRAHELQLAVER
ncbi:MAG: dipeptide/oligopeptide/nickel ABC transporter permease/ATP-binding protein [Xanthobacteraceae bacterium]|uniref:dipeptide/oligopeptide/nickel ABC transporter permease/ATP-binding protein n=1 Tax=Pseudolabrys sp. TaxID=1960880 RepID=UPI003D12DA77